MISPTQIKKPENWQDFEKLCKKLWSEIWNCSDTIKRNGRSGQNQHGVDSMMVYWKILSRNFSKSGELLIKVVPKYEDVRKTIVVENESDIKPDEIVIEPKIVEI